jgi:hypothetical protein
MQRRETMTRLEQRNRLLVSLAIAAAIGLAFPTRAAPNACKNFDKAACEKYDSCTWEYGYKRHDGIKVQGFCREKSKREKESGS